MKICLLTAAYPTGRRADSGSFIKDQAQLTREMGCEVSVVVPRIFREDELFVSDNSVKVYRFPFWSEEKFLAEYERIPVVRVLSYLVSGVFRTWQVSLRERAQVIHAHWVIPTGLIGVIVGKYLSRKPVIVTAHRADINVFPEKSIFARKAAQFVLRRSDRIITVSSLLKERIAQEYSVDEGKMTVINMGVSSSLFKRRPKQGVRQRLGLPADKKIVLFAGGLIKVKGLECLLEAMAQISRSEKGVLLVVVGAGSLEDELKERALKLGISELVRFAGERPHEELPWWISSADVVVLPSADEGLPVLVMEALAAGVPVVATRVGGTPEIVEDGKNGFLVAPGDPAALAEKISLLINDEKLHQELADNCTMPDCCNMEENAGRLKEVYLSILSG